MADGLNIDELQIHITAEASKAVNAINRLAGNLRTLGSIQLDASNIKAFVKEISELGKSTGLETLAKNLTAVAKASSKLQSSNSKVLDMQNAIKGSMSVEDALYRPLDRLSGTGKSFGSFIEQLEKLNEAGSRLYGLTSIANALERIANSSVLIKGASTAIRSLAKAIEDTAPKSRMEQIMQEFGSAEDALYDLSDAEETVASTASAAEKQTGAFASQLKVLVAQAAKAGKSLVGGFTALTDVVQNLINRIARIAFIRMIRSAIRGITNAVKEGTNALIEWDRVYGNNTSYAAKTADEIAAKWGQVKKSLGAAAMPIIQQLQPALMSLMNIVVRVAEGLNMVIRALQGYTTYMVGTTGKIGEELDDATGKAKALQRVLFGFDELNVLPSPTGSGGGSSNVTVGEGDFMEKVMDSELLRKAQSIFELVKGIGKAILGWKIAKTFLTGLGLTGSAVSGLALAAAGVVLSFTELKDQLNGGINWTNLAGLIAGVTTTVLGLWKAFGKIGAEIGLLAGGVALMVAPLKELIETGEMSGTALTQLAAGIAAVAGALSLLTGNIAYLIAGGVIAGLTALIGAVKSHWEDMQKSFEIEKYGSTIDELTQKIQDNIDAIRDRREAILDTSTPEEEELKLAKRLADQYFELSKKTTLSADEKERMAMYSAELIEIYPELNEYIDKENGLLVITEEQWQKIYDAKLKNIKLQARQERIIELEKEQIKTAEKIKEAQDKVTEAYEVYMDAIDRKMKLPVLIEETSKLLDKLIQSKGATDDLTEAEKLLLDEYTNGSGKADDLRQAIIKLYEEYGKADGNIEKTRGAYDELKGKLQELQTEYNNTGKVIEDINKGVYDNIQSVVDNTKVSPITIPVQISSRGVQSGLADIWKKGAISVNDNPLLLPVRPAGISYAEWEAGILKGYNSIRGFAEGGLPDVGTLFYAGEAGAEVVANMGHSTGVMNISQMQEAVADGNTEVVNAIYAMANMITGAVNNKDFDVYMDSAKVGQSVSKYQYNQARRGITQGGY
jgi:hypothetical protein